MKIAISGASGKTGFRIAEEAIKGGYKPKLIIRETSKLPESLKDCAQTKLSLYEKSSLDNALQDCEALLIATGARPSIDLTGPAKVDALGVRQQIESCKRVGIKHVILVSSLCAGRWLHPLNLFGLILVWKRIGEKVLENSGIEWTVIRPGGLNEREEELEKEGILYTDADIQEEAYIPRRLVARCCIEALTTPNARNRIIEITSSAEHPQITMNDAIKSFSK